MFYTKIIFILLLLISPLSLFSKELKTCVYVNSYHKGYIWSDVISKEIKNVLKDSCKVIEFQMDSKRNKDINFIKNKALQAKKLIDDTKPDVVIISDDNAAKFLVKPYFKDSKIPFIFCGINWTVKEYGFPYKNVTGMIEINPIKPLFKLALSISNGNRGLFLGDETLTDKKDLVFLKKYAKKNNIILDDFLAKDIKSWKKTYKQAQEKYDFILLGHYSTIKGWNHKDIKEFVFKNSKKIVLCRYDWMMPFSMIGLIAKPQEHGIWAGNAAKAILEGFPIEYINITTNKSWNYFLNLKLLNTTGIKIPRSLLIKSKKYEKE